MRFSVGAQAIWAALSLAAFGCGGGGGENNDIQKPADTTEAKTAVDLVPEVTSRLTDIVDLVPDNETDIRDLLSEPELKDLPSDPEAGGAEVLDLAEGLETVDVDVEEDVDPYAGMDCTPEIGCPKGVCDPATLKCVGCLVDEDCVPEYYCDDKICRNDVCKQGWKECANEQTAVQCNANGSESKFVLCEPPEICAWGNCALPLCEPASKWCTDDYYLAVCDGSGTAVQKVLCPPGFACFKGGCNQIGHNIFVIFDTSGSMYDSQYCWGGQQDCEHPWPECEKSSGVFSLLGKCKKAFAAVFAGQQEEATAKVNFALFRFPQKVVSGSPNCTSGYYDNLDKITGDNGAHVTPDGPDTWFEKSMFQVVSVPFPKEAAGSNLSKCLQWVDFVEVLTPSEEEPCTTNSQCPGGVCKSFSGTKMCHYHSNPEFRADGWTPLGRTMFYAGEYIRKFAIIEGKSCEVDEDCGNISHMCSSDGTCVDPLRHCRENVMLLFTDGEETENTSSSNFYNPVVQAKRFRYGLGCQTDDDCIPDATCTTSGYCKSPDVGSPPSYKDNEGANLLSDFNGDPIKITVHVVHAGSDSTANQEIALNGGGEYYPVNADDMSGLIKTLETIIDIKSNLEVCVPTPLGDDD